MFLGLGLGITRRRNGIGAGGVVPSVGELAGVATITATPTGPLGGAGVLAGAAALTITPVGGLSALGLELDGPDNLYAAHGTKRVLTSYSGPLVRLRRSSDNAELDFAGDDADWLDGAAIASWAGGTAFVTTMYDQTGNARHATQATAGDQPLINVAGAHPSVEFDLGDFLALTSVMANFARNVGAVSVAAVRKFDSLFGGIRHLFMITRDLNTSTRFAIRSDAGVSATQLAGRRLDTDSLQFLTGPAFTTNWEVEIARADYANSNAYLRREGNSTQTLSFQTDGLIADTASAFVSISANGSFGQLEGQLTLIAWVQDLLTDTEVNTLISSLAGMKL